ncbi:hypothetical protein EDC04DRAFT_91193 [Pisolithus marmoratus]|nr:hypothetical protein EDC04DRAFT_91193 [Pisolithus marmoratus]
MSEGVPIGLRLGPGLIGLTVALALYGMVVCQYLFYVPAFPDDKRLLRSAVLLVFILDTVHTLAILSFYSRTLINCRWNTTYACTLEMPWDFSTALGTSCLVSFFVQWFEAFLTLRSAFSTSRNSFYAHRVWIIGNRNKLLTGAVFVTALVQVVFGFALLGVARYTDNITTLFSSPYNPVNSLGSAVCDAIITASVSFYLRPSRTGLPRKDDNIQKLNLVFVQMGVITFLNAIAITILYYQDNMVGKYFTTAPGTMKCKTYSNSLLAVLNARKSIRDQQEAQAPPLELPTLPSIH